METIDKKIVGYRVKTEETVTTTEVIVEQMHENLKRPEVLIGSTYKIKTPQSEHALYVTINDMVLNQGTEHEERHPYEIFINSKNMEHYQWVVALTRVISAVFRKGGDTGFLVEELKAVFDPKGGYFKGPKYIPSLVAELGLVLEKHLIEIGQIKIEVDESRQQVLDEKRATVSESELLLCSKCNSKSVVRMDGCYTCTACGDSKCG